MCLKPRMTTICVAMKFSGMPHLFLLCPPPPHLHSAPSLPLFLPPQDLFNKFLSLILPEAVNYILSEEETTLEMFNTVASFTLSSYPGKPILEALAQLTDGLRECSLKSAPAPLNMMAALEELRNKFSSLLVSPSRDSKMTPAQVCMNMFCVCMYVYAIWYKKSLVFPLC